MSIKRTLSNIWSNKLAKIIVIIMIVITVFAIAISIAIQPGDNYKLSPEEKQLQSNIQTTTKRKDARLYEVMLQSGSWTLAKINSTDDKSNLAMVIMNDDKLTLGPSSDFPIEELVDASVPGPIIDYLYPQKPHWVYFGLDFRDYFPYYSDQIKFIITAFAQQEGISLSRITMQDKGGVSSSSSDGVEVKEFKFTFNDDRTVYTFRDVYSESTLSDTCSILSESGNILYSQTLSIY